MNSIASLQCLYDYYPSNKGSIPGHNPTNKVKSTTCRLNEDGKTAYWDNGIFKCVPGNENINTSDAILAQ